MGSRVRRHREEGLGLRGDLPRHGCVALGESLTLSERQSPYL